MIDCGEQAPDLWNTEHQGHMPFLESQGVLETLIFPKQTCFDLISLFTLATARPFFYVTLLV